jgi:hypothetical protein
VCVCVCANAHGGTLPSSFFAAPLSACARLRTVFFFFCDPLYKSLGKAERHLLDESFFAVVALHLSAPREAGTPSRVLQLLLFLLRFGASRYSKRRELGRQTGESTLALERSGGPWRGPLLALRVPLRQHPVFSFFFGGGQ